MRTSERLYQAGLEEVPGWLCLPPGQGAHYSEVVYFLLNSSDSHSSLQRGQHSAFQVIRKPQGSTPLSVRPRLGVAERQGQPSTFWAFENLYPLQTHFPHLQDTLTLRPHLEQVARRWTLAWPHAIKEQWGGVSQDGTVPSSELSASSW